MSACVFNETTHTYTIGGRVVPSVTEVIKECVGSGFEFLQNAEWYMQRGRAVHYAAKLIGQGKQITNVDPRIEGRVEALRKFFREVKLTIRHVEQPMFSEMLRLGGTPDLDADYMGRHTIFDWKSTVDKHRLPLQLGGYSALVDTNRVVYGIGVELCDDGTYTMTPPLKLDGPRRDFVNLRGTYSIRERMGLVNKKEVASAG